MNSRQLKRLFPKNYQAFFNRYDLVVSAPVLGRYPGTGLFKNRVSYIAAEKYPLRNYVGINFKREGDETIPPMYLHAADGGLTVDPVTKYYPISYSFLEQAGFVGDVGYLSEYDSLDVPSMVSTTVVANMLVRSELSRSDLASLRVENPDHREVLSRIVRRDSELLGELGFFDKRRNCSSFIGASVLASDSHLLGVSETEYRNIGPGKRFEDANHSSFLLNPHLYHRPFFQSDSLFVHGEKIRSYAERLGVPAPEVDFPESVESIGNAYMLEIFAKLQDAYDQRDTEPLFSILRLFWKFKHGVFADALDRELDVGRVWNSIQSDLSRDVSGCAVQMGTRIQIFWDRGFDISDDVIRNLSDRFGFNFTLDYSSHRDGFEHEGVRIEQWRSEGVFSEFMSENEIVSLRDRKQTNVPLESAAVPDACHDGILIDSLRERIVIKGVPTTSQAIKSQVTTIELLSRLLKSPNREACSWELPASSYSKSRSEMSSKIIGPLQRLVHEHFGAFMNLSIRNDERGFIISFDDGCPVPIYLIQKRNV